MKKIFHVVGGGKVGQTLAILLGTHSDWEISHIVSSQLPQNAFGATVVTDVARLPAADVIIIATSDNAIRTTAEKMACSVPLHEHTLVLHLSGAKSIDVLQAVAERGALTGCLHPVFSFAEVKHSVAYLAGNLCTLEADTQPAFDMLEDLATALELTTLVLSSEQKVRYHAALSAASNFSVALAAFAQDLLLPLNLPETLSRQLVCNMMQQSIDNLGKLSPLQALTGPIVRGDDSTVKGHLDAMSAEEKGRYLEWARATLALASGRLNHEAIQRIQLALQ